MVCATEEDLRVAAERAQALDFIERGDQKFETNAGERGRMLSGGERQRLSIARALLKNPPILILDEATSSLDSRTEVLIQRAMNKLRGGRTSFVIAHRLSTIRDADTILVMDGGRIVEQGSHAELPAKRGAYFELYHAQFAGAATDVA